MESAGQPRQFGASNFLEVIDGNSWVEDEDESPIKPKLSPLPRRKSSVSSDDLEPEPPNVIARKVSFADAFGLDLVSVKEFDTWDVPITSFSDPLEEEAKDIEEYFLSALFTLPSSQYELMQKISDQKVEVESIEFLPGSTSIKGIIRVLNLCFQKLVYVRMTLDAWNSFYDLMAEYIPGSSDGKTDQFSFKISLVPPYQKEGARIEFCIRYETDVGTFWANNNGVNYVLFCNKKKVKEAKEKQQEESSNKNKKSCLKTNSKDSTTEINDTVVEVGTPGVSQHGAEMTVGEVLETPVPDTEEFHEGDKELETMMDSNFNMTRMEEGRKEVLNPSASEDHCFPEGTEMQLGQDSVGQETISIESEDQEPETGTPLFWRSDSGLLVGCNGGQTNSEESAHQMLLGSYQAPLLSLQTASNKEGMLPLKGDEKEATIKNGKEEENEGDVLQTLILVEEDLPVCSTEPDESDPQYSLLCLDCLHEKVLSSPETLISKASLNNEAPSACKNTLSQEVNELESKVWEHTENDVHDSNQRDQRQSSVISQDKTDVTQDRSETVNVSLGEDDSLDFKNVDPSLYSTEHISKDWKSQSASHKDVEELTHYKIQEGKSQDKMIHKASFTETAGAQQHLVGKAFVASAYQSCQHDNLDSIAEHSTCGRVRSAHTQEEEIIFDEPEVTELKQRDLQAKTQQDNKQPGAAELESIIHLSIKQFENTRECDTKQTDHAMQHPASETTDRTTSSEEARAEEEICHNEAQDTYICDKTNGNTPEECESYVSAETETETENVLSEQMAQVVMIHKRAFLEAVREEKEESGEEDIYTDHQYSFTVDKLESSEQREETSNLQSGASLNPFETAFLRAPVGKAEATHHTISTKRDRSSAVSTFTSRRSEEGADQRLLQPVLVESEFPLEESECEQGHDLEEDQTQSEETEGHPGMEQPTSEIAEDESRNDLLHWNEEPFILHYISKEFFYCSLFIVFLVTAYHYDFIACFALYIFSVYCLCCQGRKQRESFDRK
ncbi:PPR3A phosphatase, partial [Atractosteus spatula]|nr:PPR3A phosphatase [Atractosteus spatula]